jgi:hypothetical protein
LDADPDPDPAYHFDPDPDPACHFDADETPDPTFSFMQIRIPNTELRYCPKTLKILTPLTPTRKTNQCKKLALWTGPAPFPGQEEAQRSSHPVEEAYPRWRLPRRRRGPPGEPRPEPGEDRLQKRGGPVGSARTHEVGLRDLPWRFREAQGEPCWPPRRPTP